MNAETSGRINLTFGQRPFCTNRAGTMAGKKEKLFPTHVDFLDELLGGGTKKKGVYGIIGPTGVGKSTLAAMIAGKGALNGNLQSNSLDADPSCNTKPWLFFDLRDRFDHPRMLVLSHLTKLDRNFCSRRYPPETKDCNNKSGTRATNPRLFKNIAEMERIYSGIVKRLNEQLYVSSMTERWNKGPVGIYKYAMEFAAQMKKGIGGIVIDDFGLSWYYDDNLFGKNIRERDFLEAFMYGFCPFLAEEHGCPVWVTHQMAGLATTRRPADHFSHRDAADCRNLGDHLDACFVMGTPADPDSVFSIQCTKGDRRRTSNRKLLLKHSDNWAGLELANEYVEDNRNKTWKKVREIKDQFAHGSIQIIDQLLEEIERNGGRSPVNPKVENQDKKGQIRRRLSAPIQVG